MNICIVCYDHTIAPDGQTGLEPDAIVKRVRNWYIIPDAITAESITSITNGAGYLVADTDVVGGFTTFKQQPFNYYYDPDTETVKYLQPESRNSDGNTMSMVGDSRLGQNNSIPYALTRANQVGIFDNL